MRTGSYFFYLACFLLIARGKYVTIWKKQTDGSWKFILDGGKEGI